MSLDKVRLTASPVDTFRSARSEQFIANAMVFELYYCLYLDVRELRSSHKGRAMQAVLANSCSSKETTTEPSLTFLVPLD